LTRRERELLALIAEGLTDKDIARRLNLSPATVRTYNSALYAKLGITRRTQAVAIAAGLDLTSVD
jgi:DNA-binding NarL/FixJ family response regulator